MWKFFWIMLKVQQLITNIFSLFPCTWNFLVLLCDRENSGQQQFSVTQRMHLAVSKLWNQSGSETARKHCLHCWTFKGAEACSVPLQRRNLIRTKKDSFVFFIQPNIQAVACYIKQKVEFRNSFFPDPKNLAILLRHTFTCLVKVQPQVVNTK